MREAPPDLGDVDVVTLLRDAWELPAISAEHLPWGFGAWHWRATEAGGRRWFVTADRLSRPGRQEELEATYGAARELFDRGLAFVVPTVPTTAGPLTQRLGGYALSVTEWLEGERPTGELTGLGAEQTMTALAALHGEQPPSGIGVWNHALTDRGDLEGLATTSEPQWSGGPLSGEARAQVRAHLARIPVWIARYDARVAAALATRAGWVATHGEPGPHNQIVTAQGRRWVDWESLRVAPRERDLTDLARTAGRIPGDVAADPELLEMFDLRWRLDEIATFSAWLRGPHTGTESDRVALGGLVEELTRPDWLPGDS
ncbi:phosphotransferase [Occultella kanbiaonis]|uniref:phosphotransferase n=1 Tax=Occultella kanbiaonis TaxID=2675754 RepID=UPI0012B769F1|nr:phosphotransferase [Occultella kanbiaonis]